MFLRLNDDICSCVFLLIFIYVCVTLLQIIFSFEFDIKEVHGTKSNLFIGKDAGGMP